MKNILTISKRIFTCILCMGITLASIPAEKVLADETQYTLLAGGVIWAKDFITETQATETHPVGSHAAGNYQGTSGTVRFDLNYGNLKENYDPYTIGLFFDESKIGTEFVAGSLGRLNGLDNNGSSLWDGYIEIALDDALVTSDAYKIYILCAGNNGTGIARSYGVTVNENYQGKTSAISNDPNSDNVFSTGTAGNTMLNVLEKNITLEAGVNSIRLQAPPDEYAPEFLAVAVAYQGNATKLDAPIVSLPSGNYSGNQTVEISLTEEAEEAGATIYYTLDGEDPTRYSTKYTAPITLEQGKTTTLKAYAQESSYRDSDITERVYTVDWVINSVTINPPVSNSVEVGKTINLTAAVDPPGAASMCEWIVDPAANATFTPSPSNNAQGTLKGNIVGPVTVKAKVGDIVSSPLTITVTKATVEVTYRAGTGGKIKENDDVLKTEIKQTAIKGESTPEGTTAGVTAVPDPGYRFTGWSAPGEEPTTAPHRTDTAVQANKTVTANFEKIMLSGIKLEAQDNKIRIPVGETLQLIARIEPEDALAPDLYWESSNPSIAQVDENNGLVTGIADGKVIITVSAQDGSGILASIELIIGEPDIFTVTFDPKGGTVTPTTMAVGNGNTIGTLPIPARSGFEFIGWFKADGTQFISGMKITESVTVYARWNAINPPAGYQFESGSLKYKVIKAVSGKKNGTVQVVGLAKGKEKLTKITIPKTVKLQGTFTYEVTKIGAKAFKGKKNLKTVTVGDNVTEILKNAFSGCTGLKTLTIGKKVAKIGAKAFFNDKNLRTIKINSTKLKSIGKNAFKKTHNKVTITVPKKQAAKYKEKLTNKTGLKKTVKINKK